MPIASKERAMIVGAIGSIGILIGGIAFLIHETIGSILLGLDWLLFLYSGALWAMAKEL
jgi:hypothetical protein